MSTLVIYESMFGNTRQIAEAIADSLDDARAVPLAAVDDAELAGAARVVVGGPTHAFGMSRPSTRTQAEAMARKEQALTFEPGASGDGVRELLARIDLTGKEVAAFDTRATRFGLPHAARRIDACVVHAGGRPLVRPGSFLVTRKNTLRDGELERARAWARQLAAIPSR